MLISRSFSLIKLRMLSLFTVDAFTSYPFSGNPAAVCLNKESKAHDDLSEEMMQSIASEMNISETAFVKLLSQPGSNDFQHGSHFGLRWFTPTNEVPLCGHATLAAAAVLYFSIGNTSPSLTFETKSGPLTVQKKENGYLLMGLPSNPPQPFDKSSIVDLLKVCVGDLPVRDVQYSPTTKKLLIVLDSNLTRNDLESLNPQIDKMVASDSTGMIRGVIISLRGGDSDDGYDFLSRYFAPWNGIPEDPVTGSAHTVLAPYWSKCLDKQHLRARQCSKRGGDLAIDVKGDGRVAVSGQAVIVVEGRMNVPGI